MPDVSIVVVIDVVHRGCVRGGGGAYVILEAHNYNHNENCPIALIRSCIVLLRTTKG